MSQSNDNEEKTECLHTDPPTDEATTREEKLDAFVRIFSEKRDERSFTRLYVAAQGHMNSAVRREGVPTYDVDEVVNGAAMTVWLRREKFTGTCFTNFVGFAMSTARFAALDWRRASRKWRRNTVLPTGHGSLAASVDDLEDTPGPEELLMARQELAAPSAREPYVVRKRFEGRTLEEIAQSMGSSTATVARIHEAAMERLTGAGQSER